MNDIRLSVVIPAHNEEKYMTECLESVLRARVEGEEIIVVDDGSQDRTSEIVARHQAPSARIRLLWHEQHRNKGVGASRNLGIREARGTYITFLDADDLIAPRRFERALAMLDSEQTLDGVIETVSVRFDEDEATSAWGNVNQLYVSDPGIAAGKYLEATLDGRVRVLTPSLVVRRSLFEKCGLYDTRRRLSEDYHLWLRMAACGRFAAGESSAPVAYYRRHSGNTWTPRSHDSFRDLGVVGDVLSWASRSPWVFEASADVLRRAFENKLFHCFQLAQDDKVTRKGLESALIAARHAPALLRSRRYWANIARLTL